jgi:DUF1009 family protein
MNTARVAPVDSSVLGIVAGNGSYPLLLAQRARELGKKVVVVAHRGETSERMKDLADVLVWIRVGQLGKMIKTFRRHSVTEVVFAGGIRRVQLLGGFRPDLRALKVIARARSIHDDSILKSTALEFEHEGMAVRAGTDYLTECLAREGEHTARPLSERETRDAKLAWQAAKAIGLLDIGQGAVAFDGLIIALEAVEGTDAMIERAGSLIGARANKKSGAGAVLVKTFKPQQDARLDLPTVGEATLDRLHEAGFSALVIEADRAMILDPKSFYLRADALGIAVAVWAHQPSVDSFSSDA